MTSLSSPEPLSLLNLIFPAVAPAWVFVISILGKSADEEDAVKISPVKANVLSAVIALVPVPVRIALSVKEEAPVPPWATPTSVASQTPVAIVPTAVICVWDASTPITELEAVSPVPANRVATSAKSPFTDALLSVVSVKTM